MVSVKVYYDAEGKTIAVWFDDPAQEHSAEEIGEEVVLIKNREGRIIGFERLNYTVPADEFLSVDAIAV